MKRRATRKQLKARNSRLAAKLAASIGTGTNLQTQLDAALAELDDVTLDRDAWKAKYEKLEAQIIEAMKPKAPIFGINPGSATAWGLDQFCTPLGFKHCRVDVPLAGDPKGADAAPIHEALERGYEPLVVLLWDRTRWPTHSEAMNAGTWAAEFEGKVTAFEFGNENLFNYGGAPYTAAASYLDALFEARLAIAGRVPILGQCDGNDPFTLDKFKTRGYLLEAIDGWVTHQPYHPGAAAYITKLKADLRAIGAKDSIWVTECGIATADPSGRPIQDADNYGQSKSTTYAQAGQWWLNTWADLKPLVTAVYAYCAADHFWIDKPPESDYLTHTIREQRFGGWDGGPDRKKREKAPVTAAWRAILGGAK